MAEDNSMDAFPEGLSPEAREERLRFIQSLESFRARTREVSLSILVWGPNPESPSPVAVKRNQIREKLLELGHNAMFSEELPPISDDISEKSKEFAQALSAHLIVALIESAPGASAETHDFCNHPSIAPKYYVLVPKAYKDGYSANGAIRDLENAHGGVYWYEPHEIGSCNVLTRVVVRAEALRNIYARSR